MAVAGERSLPGHEEPVAASPGVTACRSRGVQGGGAQSAAQVCGRKMSDQNEDSHAAHRQQGYVAVNSVEQQDIQSMHRIRSLLMRDRIAQINQIRGLLAEYGVVIAQTPLKVRTQLPTIIDDEHNELTG
jgi:transposase